MPFEGSKQTGLHGNCNSTKRDPNTALQHAVGRGGSQSKTVGQLQFSHEKKRVDVLVVEGTTGACPGAERRRDGQ